MSGQVTYCQLNKDYAYWIEKRRLGQTRGGHVTGLLSYQKDDSIRRNILFDAGLGTLEALADFQPDQFWDEPLRVFITHGHIDHHAELMILSEIYCQRRGQDLHDIRPPLPVFCTEETYRHLKKTHEYGFTGGNTLVHVPIKPERPIIQYGLIEILPLPVDHFGGAVIYRIKFDLGARHKIIIGWDLKTPPVNWLDYLVRPSLALVEATTWSPMVEHTGHISLETLVSSGFIEQLQLCHAPDRDMYGAYMVHYSGREDPEGMLSDQQLKATLDRTFPWLAPLVRVAERGQMWTFR